MMRLTEKYRPKTWDEILGNEDTIKTIQAMVERKKEKCPHFLFIGPPGTGKTSTAYVIKNALEELVGDKFLVGVPLIEYNASDDRGINFIRGEIKRQSEYLAYKILFLDEADALTPDAQHALRRIMEKTKTSLFILTGNNEDAFIDAIKSRCAVFEFDKIPSEIMQKRIEEILDLEAVELEDDISVEVGLEILGIRSNGDMRSALINLEKVIDKNGKITPESMQMYQPSREKYTDYSKYEGTATERTRKILEDLRGGISDRFK